MKYSISLNAIKTALALVMLTLGGQLLADTQIKALQTDAISNPTRFQEVNLQIEMPQNLVSIDLASKPDTVWQALRRGFSIPDVSNKAVRKYERSFLTHRAPFQAMLAQAEPYIHYVIEEVEKRGLPTELALLPFIESKYNPVAKSKAHAAGLWQFIPSTGKHFGLEQNKYVDERKDLMLSTEAALDYLTYLYDLKGDWHLALISYNWGEGSVARAMRVAKRDDQEPILDNLSLPRETQNYLPKLQALKNLIAYPKRFGITLPKMPLKPYFVEVKYNTNLDLRELARISRVPLGEFHKLNSGLKTPLLYASNPRPLLVPIKHSEKVLQALNRYKQPKAYKSYRVKPGDTLGHIAAKFDVSVRDIQAVNGMGSRSLIKPGMALSIPNPFKSKGWAS